LDSGNPLGERPRIHLPPSLECLQRAIALQAVTLAFVPHASTGFIVEWQ
jgi:hypothetical protein